VILLDAPQLRKRSPKCFIIFNQREAEYCVHYDYLRFEALLLKLVKAATWLHLYQTTRRHATDDPKFHIVTRMTITRQRLGKHFPEVSSQQ
jgi:hypothetical protein